MPFLEEYFPLIPYSHSEAPQFVFDRFNDMHTFQYERVIIDQVFSFE